jgi:GxxExxY protein
MDFGDFKDKKNLGVTHSLHSEITGKILKSFYQTFNHTGYGFEKRIYINSLHIELQKTGLKSEIHKTIEIYYQAIDVGNYISDMVVEDKILVKISTHKELIPDDELILYNEGSVSIILR